MPAISPNHSALEITATALKRPAGYFSLPLLFTLTLGLSITVLLFQYFTKADREKLEEKVESGTQALIDLTVQFGITNPVLTELYTVLGAIQSEVGAGNTITQDLLEKFYWDEPPPGLEGLPLSTCLVLLRETCSIRYNCANASAMPNMPASRFLKKLAE